MPDGSPRLISASAVLNAGLVLGAGFGFAFHLIAARGLEPAGYGDLTAALTYVTLWAVVMEGGVGVALTREASADPRHLAWAPTLARWRLRLALLGGGGAVVSAWLLGFEGRVVTLVSILAAGMVGLSALRLAFAVFRAVRWFTAEAALSALQKVILLPLTAGALWLGTGAPGVAIAFTASYAIAAVSAVARAAGRVRPSLAPGRDARPPRGFFLRTCLPLLAIDLLTGLYFKVDQVVLLRLRGPEETGLYAAAYRVLEALLLPVSGAMTALFPRLAGSARVSPDAFRADFVPAWRTLWLGSIVVALNGWLWAVGLLPVVFGPAYAPAQVPLHVLLAAVPLTWVNYLLTQSLVATGRERFYAVGSGVCAAVNLTLNMLLIPRWGALAAAGVTLATEATLLVICLVGLAPVARAIPLAGTLALGLAAGAVVAIGWWALPERPVERGLLALAASIALWETSAPWPVWKRWARPGTP